MGDHQGARRARPEPRGQNADAAHLQAGADGGRVPAPMPGRGTAAARIVRRRAHAAVSAGGWRAPPAGKADATMDDRTLTILVVADDAALAELLRVVLNEEDG